MDADLKRAIEESKRQAELEKNRRAAQGHDAQLRAAMEASRREEEARLRIVWRIVCTCVSVSESEYACADVFGTNYD
eukprot:1392417-Amorphochlora_amoeboformis.AAC.1